MTELLVGHADGLRVALHPFGAAIRRLEVPTRDGLQNVVLGHREEAGWRSNEHYLGVTLGRYANRIAAGGLTVGDQQYPLSASPHEDGRTLHGGPGGLSRVIWDVLDQSAQQVVFGCRSPALAEGFPGALDVSVSYRVSTDSLRLEFTATTDATTVVSLSNHAYFNLDGSETIDQHLISINADQYTPVGADHLPTGKICAVDDTPMDLRLPMTVEERLRRLDNGGFDHNYALANHTQSVEQLPQAIEAATLESSRSGLRMSLRTTHPGLQFYTGQYLDGAFRARQGLCLEPQHFPDAPNHPHFPSPWLLPGQTYRQIIEFRFQAIV